MKMKISVKVPISSWLRFSEGEDFQVVKDLGSKGFWDIFLVVKHN